MGSLNSALLEVDLLNIKMPSPVFAGSGPLTDDCERIKKFLQLGAGAVVGKTIYRGEKVDILERIHVNEVGLFNSTTYSTKNTTEWLEIVKKLQQNNLKLILSIHAQTPKLLGELASEIDKVGCLALELGIACPNDGSQQGINAKLIAEYVKEVKKVTSLPVIVKLAAVGDYLNQVFAALDAGMDILSISDTIPSVVFDANIRKYIFQEPVGYSGPSIKPIVLHAIYQIRKQNISCPIIGIGGIQTANDVLEYLHVGANAVQVYTALMLKSKNVISEINENLIKWCIQNSTSINGLVYQPRV